MNYFNKKSTSYENLTNRVVFVIRGMEVFLSGLLIILVLISSIGMLLTLYDYMGDITQSQNYDIFQQLTSFVLLLTIALELSMMLIKHNPDNVIGVMIYAIARKMLIHNTGAFDMFLGVITLVILFLVKIYLIKDIKKELTSK